MKTKQQKKTKVQEKDFQLIELSTSFLFVGFSDGIQQICDSLYESSRQSNNFQEVYQMQQKDIERFFKSNMTEQSKQILKENQVSCY